MDGSAESWMHRALELAERGRGFVEPNPLVGAVLVKEGKCVGEGWHQLFGKAHAELNALANAGAEARGSTLYVTLEPCCHHGKTPPCTEALIRAGIAHVEAAMLDPFPLVLGKGAAALRAAGISVATGVGEAQARQLNSPYLKLRTSGVPFVHAKWAMTLDGKICTASGESRWISGAESRQRVHQIRGRMDAIVVGIGTALADDPILSARPPGPRTAARIVLDTRGRLPLNSKLVQSAREIPVLIFTGAGLESHRTLRAAGCEVIQLPGGPSVLAVLKELGHRQMTNVLVEGGASVLGSFLEAKAIDEIWAFIAPKILGGSGKGPVAGAGIEHLKDALMVRSWKGEPLGGDWLLHGTVVPAETESP